MAFKLTEYIVSSVRGCKRPLDTKNILFCDKNRVDRHVSWLRREYGEENIAFSLLKGQPAVAEVYVRVN